MVDLGCIDKATEVSLLLSHSVLLCKGHMGTALHIMAYLGLHHNSHLCMDPTYPNIGNDQFPVLVWKDSTTMSKNPFHPMPQNPWENR